MLTVLCFPLLTSAQNIDAARSIIDTLTSPAFWGRGYLNNGMKKAADFVRDQFVTYGVQPLFSNSYFQPFSYPVNTFPDTMVLVINGQPLQEGVDYIVTPESKGVVANGSLTRVDSVTYTDPAKNIIVTLHDKLTWSVANKTAGYTHLAINKSAVSGIPLSYTVSITNQFIHAFAAANVCGLIKGDRVPDSLIVITAHYDHLGGIGATTYFPGANDNASGTALMLQLAKHYSLYPPPYSVVFLAFAGEEAGLTGSKYFTEHPAFSLDNIRFLINLDLAGTGDKGITVVNATKFTHEFELLKELNKQYSLLPAIHARGTAANSDHYWFTEKGVPAFFIYTMGGTTAYHDVYDKSHQLPLTAFTNLFRLIISFNNCLMSSNGVGI